MAQGQAGGLGAGDGGGVAHLVLEGGAADGGGIGDGLGALGGVDDEAELVVLDQVDDVRPALVDLVDPRAGDARRPHRRRRALGGVELETQVHQVAGDLDQASLVNLAHAEQGLARGGQLDPGADLGLAEGLAKGLADPHHLTGGLHLRPQHRVDPGEFDEGEDRLLDEIVLGLDLPRQALVGQGHAGHAARRDLGQGHADGLGDEGHGARGPGIDLQDVDLLILDGELGIHQADDLEGMAELGHLLAHAVLAGPGQGVGRQGAGGVAGMDPGLFDVLHDAADEDPLAVADGVHVHLDGVVEEAVQQHRRFVGHPHRVMHVALEVMGVVDDLHGPAAQDVGGAHHQGKADGLRRDEGLRLAARRGVGRLAQAQVVDQSLETLPVLGQVDGVGAGADDGHPGGLQGPRQLQRRLATVLDDDPAGLFLGDDLQHVLQGQGLEIEAVGGVVVGGDGLGVAVDHDRLEAVVAQGEGGVDAAIVELDALTDAVGTPAQDHDLLAIRRLGLALLLIGRVEVGGAGGELGGAGVHPLEDRTDAQGMAPVAHPLLAAARQLAQAAIGKTLALEETQPLRRQSRPALGVDLRLQGHQFLDLGQEPGVDGGEVKELLDAQTGAEAIRDVKEALGPGLAQLLAQVGHGLGVVEVEHLLQAVLVGFQAAQGLLQGLLEGATDGHHLPHRLHLGGEAGIGLGKLFEGEARDLGHHVVDAGLEGGRGGAAGDLVGQFVQGVAHRQLGRHLGDGEAGGLGGQGRGPRHPGVHLDDDHAPVLGVDGELDVGAAGVDADLAQHGDGGVAHDLVFLVREGLGRRHGDGVASVHPHGVQILDGADDDAVVGAVPHHLHLVLLPAQGRLLDQQLVGRGQVQTASADGLELLLVVGDAAATAAHGEGGADDGGEADRGLDLDGLLQAVGDGGTRHVQADAPHGLAEEVPVLGLVDGLAASADELDAVFGQDPMTHQVEGGIQRRLAAHGRQQGIRALPVDNALQAGPGNGLDVGGVGHLRVGHDGGRIGVDQHHPVALLAQGLAGLGPGVVELAGLTDDDGAGPDDEDAVDVGTLGHGLCRTVGGRVRGAGRASGR